MATRRGRLRGTSVPAGEQPPSQLPSFLSDTRLLYTQTWQWGSPTAPPPESSVTSDSWRRACFPDWTKSQDPVGKDKSFRGVCFSAVSFRWERGCLANDVVSTKASLRFNAAIMSNVFYHFTWTNVPYFSQEVYQPHWFTVGGDHELRTMSVRQQKKKSALKAKRRFQNI